MSLGQLTWKLEIIIEDLHLKKQKEHRNRQKDTVNVHTPLAERAPPDVNQQSESALG